MLSLDSRRQEGIVLFEAWGIYERSAEYHRDCIRLRPDPLAHLHAGGGHFSCFWD